MSCVGDGGGVSTGATAAAGTEVPNSTIAAPANAATATAPATAGSLQCNGCELKFEMRGLLFKHLKKFPTHLQRGVNRDRKIPEPAPKPAPKPKSPKPKTAKPGRTGRPRLLAPELDGLALPGPEGSAARATASTGSGSGDGSGMIRLPLPNTRHPASAVRRPKRIAPVHSHASALALTQPLTAPPPAAGSTPQQLMNPLTKATVDSVLAVHRNEQRENWMADLKAAAATATATATATGTATASATATPTPPPAADTKSPVGGKANGTGAGAAGAAAGAGILPVLNPQSLAAGGTGTAAEVEAARVRADKMARLAHVLDTSSSASNAAAKQSDDTGISESDLAIAVKVSALFAAHPELAKYSQFPNGSARRVLLRAFRINCGRWLKQNWREMTRKNPKKGEAAAADGDEQASAAAYSRGVSGAESKDDASAAAAAIARQSAVPAGGFNLHDRKLLAQTNIRKERRQRYEHNQKKKALPSQFGSIRITDGAAADGDAKSSRLITDGTSGDAFAFKTTAAGTQPGAAPVSDSTTATASTIEIDDGDEPTEPTVAPMSRKASRMSSGKLTMQASSTAAPPSTATQPAMTTAAKAKLKPNAYTNAELATAAPNAAAGSTAATASATATATVRAPGADTRPAGPVSVLMPSTAVVDSRGALSAAEAAAREKERKTINDYLAFYGEIGMDGQSGDAHNSTGDGDGGGGGSDDDYVSDTERDEKKTRAAAAAAMGTSAPLQSASASQPAAVDSKDDKSFAAAYAVAQPALKLLHSSIPCYVCKAPFTKLHHFYDRMCPVCSDFNYQKRMQTADLAFGKHPETGKPQRRVALVTGGRIKIGFEVVLKLLRSGMFVITTTRFVKDAALRFAAETDFNDWKTRLHIYALDLRVIAHIEMFVAHMATTYERLDVLINNAAQTIRRPPIYYQHLMEIEQTPESQLPADVRPLLCEFLPKSQRPQPAAAAPKPAAAAAASTTARASSVHIQDVTDQFDTSTAATADTKLPPAANTKPVATATATAADNTTSAAAAPAPVAVSSSSSLVAIDAASTVLSTSALHMTPAQLTQIPLIPEDSNVDKRLFPVGMTDKDNLQIDLRPHTTWTSKLHEVSTVELAEVQLVNAIAPFVLNSKLKPLLCRSREPGFVINVSSMEGKFRSFKDTTHPHTNMAKAALNMLTHTSSKDYAHQKLFMNSVDTGWVTEEMPFPIAKGKAQDGFQPPLDEIDGAARILDPIYTAFIHGVYEFGKFFKDYRNVHW